MQNGVIVCTVAILCITLMEIVAMIYLHLDGVMLSASVAAVSALFTRYYTQARCDDASIRERTSSFRGGRYSYTGKSSSD
jgi:hypothetical protein